MLWCLEITRQATAGTRVRRLQFPVQFPGLSSAARALELAPGARPVLFHGAEEDQPAKMVQRLTYRRRHSYATKSNKQRVLRTPGAPWRH